MILAPARPSTWRKTHVPGEHGIWVFIGGDLVLFSLLFFLSVAVIVIAFVKARFVIFEFMEIRAAPTWILRVGNGWIIFITGLLVARLLLGT
jgi:hypothetical protein